MSLADKRHPLRHPKLEHGLLTANGTRASDGIALRRQAGNPSVLQVDLNDDGTAELSFARADVTRIEVKARAGDDVVRIDESNGVFTDTIPTALSGERGNDPCGLAALVRIVGAEPTLDKLESDVLVRAAGNDVLIGRAPASTASTASRAATSSSSSCGSSEGSPCPGGGPSGPSANCAPRVASLAGEVGVQTEEESMTGKADFSEQEWDLVREGPPTAGMIVLTASRGGTFRETWAMAKSYAEARQQHGASQLLDDLAGERPDLKRYASPEELEQEGLGRLREAVALLEQKSPEDVEAYQSFTLAVAKRVAEAHKEEEQSVSGAEQEAMEKIRGALGAS